MNKWMNGWVKKLGLPSATHMIINLYTANSQHYKLKFRNDDSDATFFVEVLVFHSYRMKLWLYFLANLHFIMFIVLINLCVCSSLSPNCMRAYSSLKVYAHYVGHYDNHLL